MPKRSSTAEAGPGQNQIAAGILREATEDDSREPEVPTEGDKQKNPAAVELGRLGGLKGGKARAEKLSKKKRSQIAKKAAKARWGKRDQ